MPCDITGKPCSDEEFVDDPQELLGQSIKIKISINSLAFEGYREGDGFLCKYKFFDNAEWTQTNSVMGTANPQFDHTTEFDIQSINQDLLDYFTKGTLEVQVILIQQEHAVDKMLKNKTTKELGVDLVKQVRKESMAIAKKLHEFGGQVQHLIKNFSIGKPSSSMNKKKQNFIKRKMIGSKRYFQNMNTK